MPASLVALVDASAAPPIPAVVELALTEPAAPPSPPPPREFAPGEGTPRRPSKGPSRCRHIKSAAQVDRGRAIPAGSACNAPIVPVISSSAAAGGDHLGIKRAIDIVKSERGC